MILTCHKEPDQRLSDAFRWLEDRVQTVTIGNLVCALQRLNARGLDIVPFDYFDGRKLSTVPNNRINEVTGAVWELILEVERT